MGGGKGSFVKKLKQNDRVTVGIIPANMPDVFVKLRTDRDVDAELWTATGKRELALVAWRVGKISSPTSAQLKYAGGLIKYSGYNGVKSTNGALNFGHEDIQIVGKSKSAFVMKAFAFEAGTAKITYSWGADPVKCKAQKAKLKKEKKAKHAAKAALKKKMKEGEYKVALKVLNNSVKGCMGANNWITKTRTTLKEAKAAKKRHTDALKKCKAKKKAHENKVKEAIKEEKSNKEKAKKEKKAKKVKAEKAEKAKKEKAKKEKKAKKVKAEKAKKEKAKKEKAKKEKTRKEESSKEKAKKETSKKEKARKKETAAKERAQKETASKERTKKEVASKERNSKERAKKQEQNNKEKAAKMKERHDKAVAKESRGKAAERKSKELSKKERTSKERKAKAERAAKEKASKARERSGKEKNNKAQERANKERANKERLNKETSAKARAKEQAAKNHERRAKAAERTNKERSSKVERGNKERAGKERTNKARVRITRHWWHGWINGWDGNMNWQANGATLVSGLHSTHDNRREDRLFRPLLSNVGSTQAHKHWSGWVNNWDAYFHYDCPTNYALTGFISYHSNRKEDRRWRFQCARFHHLGVRRGNWPGWQTNWDATWSLSCGHAPVVGISAVHSNRKEDRLWRLRCGSFYNRI